MKDITIGIDFGTTNTVISYYKKNTIILKDSIKDYIPTKIYFGDKIYCGNNIPLNVDEKNKNLLSNFKIKIGSNFEFRHNNKILKESDILRIFFNHLKKVILKSFPEANFNTVLTVPSNFNDNQRSILINVAKISGFNILRIINEPTAAAFAYGLDKNFEDEKIMVFDIGGGTMDISVLEIDDNFFETVDSVGVNDLGGNNFTDNIYEDCLKEFKKKLGLSDILISKNKLVQLWYNCNRAKEKLSWVESCQIKINNFYQNENKMEDLVYNLDKTKFKNISIPILDRIKRKLSTIKELYKIDKLILVGGSSKLELIQDLLYEEFKIKPLVHSQLQHVVSLGACYYAALIQKELNNDEIILVDNLPLSLGIETAEGSFSKIIPKNTPLPATRSQKYTIDTPGEEEVTVKVYQGERSIAKKNYLIGEFSFNKISKIGNPIINITFKVDINGLINVTIQDKHSGSNKDILIKNKNDHIENNIDDILKEADENKDIDEKELIKTQLVYKIEIRIEQILNTVSNNNLIKKEVKDKLIAKLIEDLDNVRDKTIQELIKLDKKIDEEYFTLVQNQKLDVFDSNDNEESNELNIEETIKKEKVDFIKSKIDFYFSKNISDFQRDCLKKLDLFINSNDVNQVDLDDKIEYIKELFKENDKDELIQLCIFLKEEIRNYNLGLTDEQYKILSKIVTKYFTMLDNDENINYKEEINNLNKVCEKLINKI